jgi:hypothetical protein
MSAKSCSGPLPESFSANKCWRKQSLTRCMMPWCSDRMIPLVMRRLGMLSRRTLFGALGDVPGNGPPVTSPAISTISGQPSRSGDSSAAINTRARDYIPRVHNPCWFRSRETVVFTRTHPNIKRTGLGCRSLSTSKSIYITNDKSYFMSTRPIPRLIVQQATSVSRLAYRLSRGAPTESKDCCANEAATVLH